MELLRIRGKMSSFNLGFKVLSKLSKIKSAVVLCIIVLKQHTGPVRELIMSLLSSTVVNFVDYESES